MGDPLAACSCEELRTISPPEKRIHIIDQKQPDQEEKQRIQPFETEAFPARNRPSRGGVPSTLSLLPGDRGNSMA
ncbi:MAG: hypothetical protein AMXMBFR75_17640 [Candidatus Hinthialibacteria bacterium]